MVRPAKGSGRPAFKPNPHLNIAIGSVRFEPKQKRSERVVTLSNPGYPRGDPPPHAPPQAAATALNIPTSPAAEDRPSPAVEDPFPLATEEPYAASTALAAQDPRRWPSKSPRRRPPKSPTPPTAEEPPASEGALPRTHFFFN
jgi:hypothetical protein